MENQTIKIVFAKAERITAVVQTNRGPKSFRGPIRELDIASQRVRILRDESQTEESFETKDILAVELLPDFLSTALVHSTSRFYNDGNGNFSMHNPFDNPPPMIKPGPQNVSNSKIDRLVNTINDRLVIANNSFFAYSESEYSLIGAVLYVELLSSLDR
ncbi:MULTISPECIES: hypothetical protein [unclassified Pseudomonas]|uniref:hypothetical protein n=1 Tax=unclassified Pseudomonas TaxID=196821 RepID=UPI00111C1CE4|nr:MULTISPECIES: hypothetical protein [unclassified Pseudomonas]